MKNPWIVTWWCTNLDKACKQGFATYEAAITKQFKLQKQGHHNVQVNLK